MAASADAPIVAIIEAHVQADHLVTPLVGDCVRGEDPWFALTGDTLFVGDAGRPDLDVGTDAADAASDLYDSLQRLLC